MASWPKRSKNTVPGCMVTTPMRGAGASARATGAAGAGVVAAGCAEAASGRTMASTHSASHTVRRSAWTGPPRFKRRPARPAAARSRGRPAPDAHRREPRGT
ncbi:hypothetical protein G6F32_015592 [Rhizopus arrhizus]|nr:hypothetical protein G6F32_015592 [Rhizopus arrhizus]